MTTQHCGPISSLALALLLLLAACAPAAPVTQAPATPPPDAILPPPATPTPAPTETPSPTPAALPQAVRQALEGGLFTAAEEATLTARLTNPPAEWNITPETDVQADRYNDYILLTTINRQTNEPTGQIIILTAVDAPTWVIADLAGARATAEVKGQPQVSYIMVDYESQVVGVDESGQTVMIFDIATGTWFPAFTPIAPEATATPDATEALKQHPWEVQYTAGPGGELTAQYYNATTKEVVSVVAPEIENLQKSIWDAPDGRQMIIYQDTANAQGLANYRYPYNLEAGQYFPEGTIAWLEPKLLVNYPDGKSVRGGIVMVPEFQAQRQAQATADEKLQGRWRIGLPFTQAPSETLTSDIVVGIWNGYSHILEVDFNPKNGVVVVNPIEGKGLTTSYGTNPTDHIAEIKIENIVDNGYLSATDAEKGFAVRVNETSTLNPTTTQGNQHTTHTGETLVNPVTGQLKLKGTAMSLVMIVTGPNGSWKSFGLGSLDIINGAFVMTAPKY